MVIKVQHSPRNRPTEWNVYVDGVFLGPLTRDGPEIPVTRLFAKLVAAERRENPALNEAEFVLRFSGDYVTVAPVGADDDAYAVYEGDH